MGNMKINRGGKKGGGGNEGMSTGKKKLRLVAWGGVGERKKLENLE